MRAAWTLFIAAVVVNLVLWYVAIGPAAAICGGVVFTIGIALIASAGRPFEP